jgi:hypothetical protein
LWVYTLKYINTPTKIKIDKLLTPHELSHLLPRNSPPPKDSRKHRNPWLKGITEDAWRTILLKTGEELGQPRLNAVLDIVYPEDAPSTGFVGNTIRELKKRYSRDDGPMLEYQPWQTPFQEVISPVPNRQTSRFMLLLDIINKAVDGVGMSLMTAQWADRLDFTANTLDEILRWIVIDEYRRRTFWCMYPPEPGGVPPFLTADLDTIIALAPWDGSEAACLYKEMLKSKRAGGVVFERLTIPTVDGELPIDDASVEKIDFAIWANRKLGMPYDLILDEPEDIEIEWPSIAGINDAGHRVEFPMFETGIVSTIAHRPWVFPDYQVTEDHGWRKLLLDDNGTMLRK